MYRVIAITLILLTGCTQLPASAIPEPSAQQKHAVVFDIDGTLTPDVWAVSEVRPDAAKVIQAYANKGYKIIYLSTRVAWLSAGIPDWLNKHGFPQGTVHVAQSSADRDKPEIYKAQMLQAFQARGWSIDYAFGDSSSDFIAYASAGIPQAQVFALQRRGDKNCQPGIVAACLKSWSEHREFVENTVPSLTN